MAHPTGPVADAFADRIRRLEDAALAPHAVPSYRTRGRSRPDDDCLLRTPFQRDRDRIVHTKAFRRLKGKTQVFIEPRGDHFRTRLTHTLEVAGISRTVARALRLNEDLTEAVALGHDLGHPPFGHVGEAALDDALRRFGRRFRHNEQSLRVVDALERDGAGLNLTAEVRDGILTHTGARVPLTHEARIVRLVDRIAYVNHDIDDAVRAGILAAGDLPAGPIALLGAGSSRRIDAMVHDLVETSDAAADIRQSPRFADALLELRGFMFDRVYLGPVARREKDRAAAAVRELFELYVDRPELLPRGEDDVVVRATDWLAGMTDRYCTRVHEELLGGALSPPAAHA
jgi:dGTPase